VREIEGCFGGVEARTVKCGTRAKHRKADVQAKSGKEHPMFAPPAGLSDVMLAVLGLMLSVLRRKFSLFASLKAR
jgi:hypothetical protein